MCVYKTEEKSYCYHSLFPISVTLGWELTSKSTENHRRFKKIKLKYSFSNSGFGLKVKSRKNINSYFLLYNLLGEFYFRENTVSNQPRSTHEIYLLLKTRFWNLHNLFFIFYDYQKITYYHPNKPHPHDCISVEIEYVKVKYIKNECQHYIYQIFL